MNFFSIASFIIRIVRIYLQRELTYNIPSEDIDLIRYYTTASFIILAVSITVISLYLIYKSD